MYVTFFNKFFQDSSFLSIFWNNILLYLTYITSFFMQVSIKIK